MDKQALYRKARTIQQMADELMGMVLAMEEAPPSPSPEPHPQVEGLPQMVGVKYLAERFDVGKSTIEGWAREGIFPPGELLFNQRVRRWNLDEVKEWMAANGRGEQKEKTHGPERKAGRKARSGLIPATV